MGFFSPSSSDDEWILAITPICQQAKEVAELLDESLQRKDFENEGLTLGEITQVFPSLRDSLRHVPSPTSRPARQAKKSLEDALKEYAYGADLGLKYIRDMQNGLAMRVMAGGVNGRAAASRASFQKSLYLQTLALAQEQLYAAARFLEGTGVEEHP